MAWYLGLEELSTSRGFWSASPAVQAVGTYLVRNIVDYYRSSYYWMVRATIIWIPYNSCTVRNANITVLQYVRVTGSRATYAVAVHVSPNDQKDY